MTAKSDSAQHDASARNKLTPTKWLSREMQIGGSRIAKLRIAEREVLRVVAAKGGRAGGGAKVRQNTIAEKLNISKKTVLRILAKLEGAGFIARIKNTSESGRNEADTIIFSAYQERIDD